jgi:hypothetical protein
MWICSRCQTANKDGYTQCVECSAPRNSRRFGAGTPVVSPSLQAQPSERRMQTQPAEEPAAPSPRRQPVSMPEAARRHAPGRFIRLIGLLLAVLLPLLVIILAVVNAAALRPLIAGIFVRPEPLAAGFVLPVAPLPAVPLRDTLLYIFSVLAAALLALYPGLSLWARGRLLKGFRVH